MYYYSIQQHDICMTLLLFIDVYCAYTVTICYFIVMFGISYFYCSYYYIIIEFFIFFVLHCIYYIFIDIIFIITVMFFVNAVITIAIIMYHSYFGLLPDRCHVGRLLFRSLMELPAVAMS